MGSFGVKGQLIPKKVFFEDVNGKNLDLDLEQAVG
jgi:hypothetical protein